MDESLEDQLWDLVHVERASLAEDLAALSPEQWRHGTLCGLWDVEHVVAHLTAAASLNQWQWLRSMLGARFRPAVHNQRRIQDYLGVTPSETLEKFVDIVNQTIAPSAHTPAYLGEVVVHAADIRRPLGIAMTASVEALSPVAEFYASRNFAVDSRSNAADLRLEANDGRFAAGKGPLVTGTTLALVMAMAGRPAYLEDLQGPGVQILRSRIEHN